MLDIMIPCDEPSHAIVGHHEWRTSCCNRVEDNCIPKDSLALEKVYFWITCMNPLMLLQMLVIIEGLIARVMSGVHTLLQLGKVQTYSRRRLTS